MPTVSGFVMVIGGDSLGRGDQNLGGLLMERFLHELGGVGRLPEKLIFINFGVRLVAADSPVIDQLRRLEQAGVDIAACSTCLERFGLLDESAVGRKTDMRTTVAAITDAEKVVSV